MRFSSSSDAHIFLSLITLVTRQSRFFGDAAFNFPSTNAGLCARNQFHISCHYLCASAHRLLLLFGLVSLEMKLRASISFSEAQSTVVISR